MRRRALPLLLLLLAGCAGGPVPPPVFTDAPAVTRVRDDAPIPVPDERGFHRLSYLIENYGLRQPIDVLGVTTHGPALDVNRLGEVPASSWYAGTDDRQDPAAVARGPGGDDPGPEAHRPWTVTGLKVGGRNPGFVFRDARGAAYICKFDKEGEPSVSTAAGAVAARLFWALGYHVPDNRVVTFARDELLVAPDATVKNSVGEKRPLTRADVDAMLAGLPQALADGRYRALVSRFLDGIPRGGFSLRGTNGDDPNDRIPHQDRRSLRALRVFGAWLQHVDLKEDNTLDVYVGEPGAGHLRHHLVDFDGCLGGYWAARHEKRIGHAYDFDWRELLLGIPALGLHVRPYEDTPPPAHAEVGQFSAFAYDPAAWRPNYANDQVLACGPADAFWAGTVLARLSDEALAAAASTGRFRDPAAAAELTRVLIARRHLTLAWALTRVSPAVDLEPIPAADGFRVDAASACDRAGLAVPLAWRVEFLNADGSVRQILSEGAASPAVTVPATDADRAVVRWTAHRPDGGLLPPTQAHYARGPAGWSLRGVLRDGE
ncbi:MAG TPA: hypothetical protein PLH84_14200 [Candidatus Krumholzibacteria bacterium]|nr:hypothetical protein [Candidatus Krumholzibacteria bacterium]